MARRGRLILIVDPDLDFVEDTRLLLNGERLLTARSLDEAEEIAVGGRVDAAILGPSFGNEAGVRAAAGVLAADPKIHMVLAANVITNRVLLAALQTGLADVIDTPLTVRKLAAALAPRMRPSGETGVLDVVLEAAPMPEPKSEPVPAAALPSPLEPAPVNATQMHAAALAALAAAYAVPAPAPAANRPDAAAPAPIAVAAAPPPMAVAAPATAPAPAPAVVVDVQPVIVAPSAPAPPARLPLVPEPAPPVAEPPAWAAMPAAAVMVPEPPVAISEPPAWAAMAAPTAVDPLPLLPASETEPAPPMPSTAPPRPDDDPVPPPFPPPPRFSPPVFEAEPAPGPEEGPEVVHGASATSAGRAFELAPDDEPVAVLGGGRVVVVMAGKGGSGKSVTATNLALALTFAAGEDTVAIVDADLQFGDVALLLQMDPIRSLSEVVRQVDDLSEARLDALLLRHESGLRVLPAPLQPAAADSIPPKAVVQVVEKLRRLYRYVVVDTGAVLDDVLLSLLDEADDVVVVVDMDLPSVKNAKVALDILRAGGYPMERLRLVVNRINSKARLDLVELERSLGLRTAAAIPSDRLVPQSVNEGIPVVALSPRSRVSRAFTALAKQFLQPEGR